MLYSLMLYSMTTRSIHMCISLKPFTYIIEPDINLGGHLRSLLEKVIYTLHMHHLETRSYFMEGVVKYQPVLIWGY